VPGCGRGYDVLLLARLGYDAYGLDVSAKAIAEAQAYQAGNPDLLLLLPLSSAADADADPDVGTATFLQGDFWASDWLPGPTTPTDNAAVQEEEEEPTTTTTFDLIFDFTFLCALPPAARGAWARRTRELLAPGTGRLVCLEFPLGKPAGAGGPPFGLTEGIYGQLLTEGEGMRRLARWRPERSHARTAGKDMVSVWGV
jgi:SAM-dependent methyltransferase